MSESHRNFAIYLLVGLPVFVLAVRALYKANIAWWTDRGYCPSESTRSVERTLAFTAGILGWIAWPFTILVLLWFALPIKQVRRRLWLLLFPGDT